MHGRERTAKLGDQGVAGTAKYTALVIADAALDQVAILLEGAKRTGLVAAHHVGECHDIGGKNRRQLAFKLWHPALGLESVVVGGRAVKSATARSSRSNPGPSGTVAQGAGRDRFYPQNWPSQVTL